jgi:membrane-associated phospholipid phosphatase
VCSRYGVMRRIVVLTLLATSSIAGAQTPGTGSGSDAGSNAPVEPGAGSGSAAEIAKPAPDAPPEKVQEAKDVAKQAELTPLIPSPENPTRPAFQLYAELDPPILSIGLVYMLARRIKQQPAYCAPRCDAVDINWLDRRTAGYYSSTWSLVSDINLVAIGAVTGGMLIVDEGFLNTLNDSVVIAEAVLAANAFATVMTVAAGRPRPFLYSDDAPLELRNSANASLSFLSSHTADAFAIVTAAYVAQRRLHPKSNRSRWYYAAGFAAASFVGFSRVMSGYHFITDAIGGAVVGTSMGFIVTAVHKSPVKIVPVVNKDAAGNVTGAGLGLAGAL